MPSQKFRVIILIGHSLEEPLPEAIGMAKAAVRDFQHSGLAIEIRIDVASTDNLRREARRGRDLLIYYGHGNEDGQLAFVDGPKSFQQLAAPLGLEPFWQDLPVCFVFACYGNRFAAALPCPWIAFTTPILRHAPPGFLHALTRSLSQCDLREAVEEARERAAYEMQSTFAEALQLSTAPLPRVQIPSGKAVCSRASPALFGHTEVDFYSMQVGHVSYPEHDPFVGRREDIEQLLQLPSPYADYARQRVVWVQGDPGMGKSALLRQFAVVVSDLEFRDADDPLYVLHLYCWNYTRPEDLEHAICDRAARLYTLEEVPSSLSALVRRLETRAGTHVWILDDLTYLSVQPDSHQEATGVVQRIVDAARSAALPLQLVVSTRRPGPKHWESIRVEPLQVSDALRLARIIRRWDGLAVQEQDIIIGASQLFRHVGGATALYKRALLLAVERDMSYQEYAAGLAQQGSLDALDAQALSEHMVKYEVEQLAALQVSHGFDYPAFLKIYYPLIAKASFFTSQELRTWFGEKFRVRESRHAVETAYRNGIDYLARLGFLLVEKRPDGVTFSMPPNQRLAMQVLSDPQEQLPGVVPLRGVQQRLSLALERVKVGELEALSDLLAMEHDYLPYIDDPDAAAAVSHALMLRAGLADIFDRSEEEIQVYDEVVTRFGDREEVVLAEQVARALYNKGVRLGSLNRSEAAIEVYDEVVTRFGDREEVVLAERVARAHIAKAITIIEVGENQEEGKAILRAFIDLYQGTTQPAFVSLVEGIQQYLNDLDVENPE